jgi:hypothetical protein
MKTIATSASAGSAFIRKSRITQEEAVLAGFVASPVEPRGAFAVVEPFGARGTSILADLFGACRIGLAEPCPIVEFIAEIDRQISVRRQV